MVSHLAKIPVTTLNSVGPKISEMLARLDIYTVQDLLFHLPLRYEDRTRITSIDALKPGDHVLIEGRIQHTTIIGKRKKNLLCRIADDTGFITLRFFHFTSIQHQRLNAYGLLLRCFGEIRRGYQGGLEMIHPEYRKIELHQALPLSNQLTPIYPTTKGLHQLTLRKLTEQALTLLKNNNALPELLPDCILQKFVLPTLESALQYVHRPPANIDQEILLAGKHPAQRRLAIEELIAHQISLQQIRRQIREHCAPIINNFGSLRIELENFLPFHLTNAQRRVINEIVEDLKQTRPMLRLVQGDVGSGKTVVAAMAALQAIEQKFQVAVMAPTEILAEQHFKNFTQWFVPLGVNVGWLSGAQLGSARQNAISNISNGTYSVVIGTHALFQEHVQFKNLALMIIDEQHRFGVHQRLALKEKGIQNEIYPHQLIMTATPIPRTLAMMAYADLDCSIIDELPPGRKLIKTILVSNSRRAEIIERVRIICRQGHQAYWICTLIEDSEVLQCQAAEATTAVLQKKLSELNVRLIHGRMKADEKEKIMTKFKHGDIDLLIATTVVEVGVDNPNANLMIIENSERLGLAQLHQLRGRVGRGTAESHCVLLYQSPLSKTARERLWIMRNTQDGFEIARKDLEMRGPGEVLGTRQAGLMRLRIADLLRDKDLLPQVNYAGQIIVTEFPQLVLPLIARWIRSSKYYAGV